MKVFRIVVAVAAFAAFTILAQTQTRPAATPTTVAIIDSAAFSDEKAGIARVMVAMQQLEARFLPVRNELRTMRERLNTMRTDIQKKRQVQEPSLTAKQTEDADRLELEIKRKAEDARADYQKQIGITLQPLQAEVATALNTYAQAHGILIIIDVNRVPLIYANESIDITKDFIAEYNRAHPAGGAPATTRP